MRRHSQLLAFVVSTCILSSASAQSLSYEKLDRGLVAVRTDQGIFLSWRLLLDDPPDIAFNVLRLSKANIADKANTAEKLNEQPVRESTTFIDATPPASGKMVYRVVPTSKSSDNAKEQIHGQVSINLETAALDYLEIPTEIPPGYHANDTSVGDLDGDGRYELVVHVAGRGQDNSRGGMTDPPLFHAYTLDGRRLWEINLGKNVREGAHYNPFLVFDFDGDGHAEFVCRTADGTIDGQGQKMGDSSADWRVPLPDSGNGDFGTGGPRRRRLPGNVGKILSGPEFLTVFDGRTGAARDSVVYLPRRAPENDSPSRKEQREIWGDDYGNRMDRFLATIAFLDGEHPSIVMSRGYYTRTVIAAWDFRDGHIQKRWIFDSDETGFDGGENPWAGQGNHSISVADVDNDGRDEIIFGSMVIDDDGTGMYSTKLGHGDAQHTGDLDPSRPGLETWSIHETGRPAPFFVGAELRDAQTGEILFVGSRGRDVARGMAADIDPRYPGAELWGGSRSLFSVQGKPVGRAPRSTNMAIWWDGDTLRELLDGVRIEKWDHLAQEQRLLLDGRRQGVLANNGSKNNPCLAADLLGDWREELVARSADNKALRIFVSTIPTRHRRTTLMQDRQYRLGIGWQNVGYNQPPHTSFFFGEKAQAPPPEFDR